MSKYLYSNGLPFSSGLDKNLDALRDRIETNKASLLIIDGGVGEGKTTLAVHCAEYFQKSKLNFSEQLAMGGVQFQEKLEICHIKKHPVLIYDEAGDFNSRSALTKFNQRLNRIFETYRTFKILIILTLPNFSKLDNSLFDNKIPRLLLHVHGRTKKEGNYAGYSLYRMHYIKEKMRKYTVPSMAYGKTTPNFRGHFKDLTPERSRELDIFTTKGKENILSDNILKAQGLIYTKEISMKLQRTDRWVRNKLKELKIEPARIYKKKKYYHKEILDLLRDERRY